MNKSIFFISTLFFIANLATIKCQNSLIISYDKPAQIWEETIPLGNGRIGMMPDGGIEVEKIVLNDITMWSGSYDAGYYNSKAKEYLPEIQKLLLEGKNIEAQRLMYSNFKCGGLGSAHGNAKDAAYGSFQKLGDLKIKYKYNSSSPATNYKRQLSLNNAIACTKFKKGNTKYYREYFASLSDDVLIIHLRSNKKNAISFDIELDREECADISAYSGTIIMRGNLNSGIENKKGLYYFTKIKILNHGGKIISNEKSLSLTGTDEAIIMISTSTNMLDTNCTASVNNLLIKALAKSYNSLKNDHKNIYQDKFNRVNLDLGKLNKNISTPDLLNDFQNSNDPTLATLYFQFGRYLMISGSKANMLPLNLQGMWANSLQTPWNGDYHLNVNLQMNYWGAEVCNLSELHNSLVNYTKSLVPSGIKTAKDFYNAEGWVAHTISNPWFFTAPGEHASWGATITCGAWLCQNLWEHYMFSQNKEYLNSIYPTMKSAADFFLSNMIEDTAHKWLVTAPSSSPENCFFMPNSNDVAYVCMGPTMDIQIIRDLFENVIKAADILKIDENYIKKVKAAIDKLPPIPISSNGYLQEWLEDYKEVDIKHRHVSHLYGLYPSNQISLQNTPALANAARITLDRRGDSGTGWSMAWKICFWSRLKDGNRAYILLKNLLKPALAEEENNVNSAGTYPNLFCAHPPFQIDGNLGGMAGIAEMLIQSQDGYIEVLPALPSVWENGNFNGLCVRGGAEISAEWIKNKVKKIIIKATNSNNFVFKIPIYSDAIWVKNKKMKNENGFISIYLKKGEKAILRVN